MAAEAQPGPQEWPAPLSSGGGGGPSLAAIVFTILVIVAIISAGTLYGALFGLKGLPRMAAPAQRAEAQTVAAPVAPPPSSAVDPGDMNTLGPQFGEFLAKHPEYTARIDALQGLMDANRQSVKNLCASISAVCAHASSHDPTGACKNRPPQCAQ